MISTTRASAAAAAAEKNPFSVFPEQADVRPGQSQEFRVSFRPTKDHAYYARALECFAYVKSMRSFRQVTEETFTPPWTCASVRAGAHLRATARRAIGFMPKCRFTAPRTPSAVPAHGGGRATRTRRVALINDGDVAVSFEFPDKRRGVDLVPTLDEDDELGGSPFSPLTPRRASCTPGRSPSSRSASTRGTSEPRREILVCALNGSTEHALALDVRARGHVPEARVGADNSFVFKPTCVGAVTARDVDVTNVSRINVLYEWDIPEKLASTIAWSPAGGMIRGGETVPSQWTFCPQKIKRSG